jgi:hypothetical protein
VKASDYSIEHARERIMTPREILHLYTDAHLDALTVRFAATCSICLASREVRFAGCPHCVRPLDRRRLDLYAAREEIELGIALGADIVKRLRGAKCWSAPRRAAWLARVADDVAARLAGDDARPIPSSDDLPADPETTPATTGSAT